MPTTLGLVSQGQVPVHQAPIAQSGLSGEPDQSTQTYPSACLPGGCHRQCPWSGPGGPDGVGAGGTKSARPWPLALVVGFSVLFPWENTQYVTRGLAAACQHPAEPGCGGLSALPPQLLPCLCTSAFATGFWPSTESSSGSASVIPWGSFHLGRRDERGCLETTMMMAGHI